MDSEHEHDHEQQGRKKSTTKERTDERLGSTHTCRDSERQQRRRAAAALPHTEKRECHPRKKKGKEEERT